MFGFLQWSSFQQERTAAPHYLENNTYRGEGGTRYSAILDTVPPFKWWHEICANISHFEIHCPCTQLTSVMSTYSRAAGGGDIKSFIAVWFKIKIFSTPMVPSKLNSACFDIVHIYARWHGVALNRVRPCKYFLFRGNVNKDFLTKNL